MSITTITWKPTTNSVARKNTKDSLAWVIIQIWNAVHELEGEEFEKKVTKILLSVL